MNAMLVALAGLPLAAGVALLVAGRRADRGAAGIGVLVAMLVLAIAVPAAVARPAVQAPFVAGLPVGLAVDGLSAVMVVTVAAVTLVVLVYAVGEIGPDEARARFFGLMLLFAGAMLVTVTATTVLTLLMAWEVMGAASYGLIAFWWRERWRVRAATTAFVTTRAGDLGLYLAAGAAFAGTRSLDLGGLADLPAPWLHAVTVGVLLAAAGKSAQLPFSFWLSGAMAGPSSVSALLHSATMAAAGGYLLLRLSEMLHASGWGGLVAAVLGAATALVLGGVACVQRDLKQLLAASTCAQVGFMVLAAGVGSVAGGAAHLAGHAAVKSLLFLAAGAWLTVLGSKALDRLRGAGRRYPLVGVTAAVGALALAGVPPLALWVTKDLALAGAPTALWMLALAASALSAIYAGRALFIVLAPRVHAGLDADRDPPRGPVPGSMRAALAALAVPAAGFGVVVAALPGPGPPFEPTHALTSAVVAVAALTLVAVWVRRGSPLPGPVAAAGERWAGLQLLAERGLARPTLRLASVLARFDDRVLAAGVDGAGRGSVRAAGAANEGVERGIGALVSGIARGGRRLGMWARNPQTGQLHQYYAQAAVVLGVLVIVVTVVLVG